MNSENLVGEVIHFYNKIFVAVVRLKKPLCLGDLIWFYGAHTDFGQEVDSIQIGHKPVREGLIGEEIAIHVHHRVRTGDTVYLVSELPEGSEGYEDFEYFGG